MRISLVFVMLLAVVCCTFSTVSKAVPSSQVSGLASGSGGDGCHISPTVTLKPSATSCEVDTDCEIDFTISIKACSIGQISYSLDCDDALEPSTTLQDLGERPPGYLGSTSATLVINGLCNYQTGGTKNPTLTYDFRGVGASSTTIEVTEPTASITVGLTTTQDRDKAPADITMTAQVTGEEGEDVTCKFWCDDDTVAYADLDNDGSTGPQSSGIVINTAACQDIEAGLPDSCSNANGGCTAAVACLRNGAEATNTYNYTVEESEILVHYFSATPPQGQETLDNVQLETEFETDCDPDGEVRLQFGCNDPAPEIVLDTDSPLPITLGDYVTAGVDTYKFNMTTDGSLDCDGYTYADAPGGDGVYTPTLSIDCGSATQATATTTVTATVGATDTFSFYAAPEGSSYPGHTCTIGAGDCSDIIPVVLGWSGTATGDFENIKVDCVNDDATWDANTGLDVDPEPYSGFPYMRLTPLDANYVCDYESAGAGIHEMEIEITRDTITETARTNMSVTAAPVVPRFLMSPSSPASIHVVSDVGGPTLDRLITITNDTGGNLDWDSTGAGDEEDKPWLDCTPSCATGCADPGAGTLGTDESEVITCTLDPTGLGQGSEFDTVKFRDPLADNNPVEVTFHFEIIPIEEDWASSMTTRGITFNFDDTYQVGRFIDGEPWVVENTPGSGVGVTSTLPAYTMGPSGWQNGWEINPRADTTLRSLDQCAADCGREPGTFVTPPSLPRTLSANESMVKIISHDVPGCNNPGGAIPRTCVRQSSVLTVLDTAPAPNSFRPPMAGDEKPIFRAPSLAEIGTRLPDLPTVTNQLSMADALNIINGPSIAHPGQYNCDLYKGYESSTFGYSTSPALYGAAWANAHQSAILRTFQGTAAEKQELVNEIIQVGIDTFGAMRTGKHYYANGAIFPGRKALMLYVAVMLEGQVPANSPISNYAELMFDLDITGYYNGVPLQFFEDGLTFTCATWSHPDCIVVGEAVWGAVKRGDVWSDSFYDNCANCSDCSWRVARNPTGLSDGSSCITSASTACGGDGGSCAQPNLSTHYDNETMSLGRYQRYTYHWFGSHAIARILKLETEWNWPPFFEYVDRISNPPWDYSCGDFCSHSFQRYMHAAYARGGPIPTAAPTPSPGPGDPTPSPPIGPTPSPPIATPSPVPGTGINYTTEAIDNNAMGCWLISWTDDDQTEAQTDRCEQDGAADSMSYTGSTFTTSNGPAGTPAGTTSIQDASSLDGTDDYFFLPDLDKFEAGTFTTGCWVKPGNAGEQAAIISKEDGANYEIRSTEGTNWRGEVVTLYETSTSNPPTLGEWIHIVLRYDEATDQVELFVNGALDCDGACYTQETPPAGNTEHLVLGATQSGGSELTGQLMECFYIDQAMTDTEIAEIFLCGLDGNADGVARDAAFGGAQCSAIATCCGP